MNRLIVATTNPHKLREVRAVLSNLDDWTVEGLPEGLPAIEETGATFHDNAAAKAVHFSLHVDAPTLADDSGLSVAALDGRPGVRSARYAATDRARIERLLKEMESVPDDSRQASFVCALALARRGRLLWSGEGRVDGRIARAPRGSGGFGYDPIFEVPDGRTMAELSPEEKNRISHRGQALEALRRFLAGQPDLG